MAALRVSDLTRFLVDQYGPALPDDDAGREDLRIVAAHLAKYQSGDAAARIRFWTRERAPWMTADETEQMIEHVLANPRRWTAQQLAHAIGLDYATRQRLGIKTIGAIDRNRKERRADARERSRVGKEARRRAAGAISRREYLRRFKMKPKPWLRMKISERTYYRRKRAQMAAGSATHGESIYVAGPPATH